MSPILADGQRPVGRAWPAAQKPGFVLQRKKNFLHAAFSGAVGQRSWTACGDGAPGGQAEDAGSAADAGVIHLLYGGATGIDATGNSQFTQGSTGAGSTEAGDRFGAALGHLH